MTNIDGTTRRGLLRGLAAAGGMVTAWQAMNGFRPLPQGALAAVPETPANVGRGKTVIVLGAGVGGICAAYELERKGYTVIVLEAASHAGGRSLTLRRGDTFQEMGGPVQRCTFEEGGWMNAGPGRIPHHHVNVVDYCRSLGVTLEPYIFSSRANLTTRGIPVEGQPRVALPTGRVLNDLRGEIAAMLDRCMKMSSTDRDPRLTAMLAEFGGLSKPANPDDPWPYTNASGRAGYVTPPGVLVPPPQPLDPIPLQDMLKSEVWKESVFRETRYYWQSSLMQPVGGMDMFWKGFLRQKLAHQPGRTVANLIRYNAPAWQIQLGADKVTVWVGAPGTNARFTADFCISTIPMPVFAKLRTNLDDTVMKAAASIKATPSGKVGWQAERFWEAPGTDIFGGISWVDGLADQVWYPSDGFLSHLGVLTGAYMSGKKAEAFNAKPIDERMRLSRAAIDGLQPGSGAKLKHGVAIAWEKMEHIQMGFLDEDDEDFKRLATILAAPQGGRLFQAGDQLTWLSGWQEGAILTAKQAVGDIVRRTGPG